jgi:protein SPT2
VYVFGLVTITIIVQGYHRGVEDEYGDEYYDQDEYEEEGSGAGDEYVEEEEPTEGQKEILELRERLKEQIRRKAKAAAACTAGRSSSSQIPQARDKYV